MLKGLKLTGWRWLIWVLLVVGLDQLSKYAVVENISRGQEINLVPGFNLILAHNYGIAFSAFHDTAGTYVPYLSLLAIAIVAVLLVWLLRTPREQKLLSLALSSIIGGAIGNLIDRFHYGYVIDFLDVYVKTWHWPTFNVADSFISVGAFIALIAIWKQDKS